MPKKSSAKKLAYMKARCATAANKKYRAELARERRARGIMGEGGKDVSHVKGGGFKLESASKNRARNGKNGKTRLASGTGTRAQNTRSKKR